MKKIFLVDEYGLKWCVLENEPQFPLLAKLKLHETEYACWRESFLKRPFTGLKVDRQKLEALTREAQYSTDDTLLDRLIHAACTYTTTFLYRGLINELESATKSAEHTSSGSDQGDPEATELATEP